MSEVEALRAALESRDAQLSRQNAGLVQMARERDAALAELSAIRDAASDFTRVDPHGWARIRELESERDFARRTAANRALELRDVWRMVTGEPIADDEVPMVIMAVRFMVERHDTFKASTERLSAETVDLRAALASVTAECARLRSDLDVEREQSAAFVQEIKRLRVVEAGAAIMRRVLNEVGRHAEWASTVRECLRDGAGSAFLARLVSAERDLDHARQELELGSKGSARALDAADAEVKSLRAEVKRLKLFEIAELQRRAIIDAMNGGEP